MGVSPARARDIRLAQRGPEEVRARTGPYLLLAESPLDKSPRGPRPGAAALRRRPGRTYYIHPGLLDSAFQLLGSILPGAGTGIDAYVPMAFKRLQCFADSARAPLGLGNADLLRRQVGRGQLGPDRRAGARSSRMEGATLQRVSRDWIARLVAGPLPDWCYELAWVPEPLGVAAVDETAVEAGRWLI